MQRIFTLDLMRTLAIVLMVIFHFIYDLKFFGYIQTDIPDGVGWQQFRWIIITLFFVCLGASLQITHRQQIKFKKLSKRVFQIALGALVISIGSYMFLRENWIFFGVLHFLALSAVLGVCFVKVPVLSLIVGIVFLIAGAMEWVPTRWPFYLIFDDLPHYTNDYVAFIPWFGMVLVGIYLGQTRWLHKDPAKALIATGKPQSLVAWPGKHSLSIYILHQPILMTGLYLISKV